MSSQYGETQTFGHNKHEPKIWGSAPLLTSAYRSETDPVVWGTQANFNGFRVLAALLHGTPVVGVSQTLRRRTEGATYIRQGDHHVGHRPAF